MSDVKTTEIKLVCDYVAGEPKYETVPAVEIGPNQFRLLGSPGFAPGVAIGDEIEFSPKEKHGYRVLRRSGQICVQLFLRNSCSLDQRIQITGMVNAANGKLDGGKDGQGGHLLIYNFPVSGGFAAIQEVMAAIQERFDVDTWMYGNVYSTSDGVTPLNWWLKK